MRTAINQYIVERFQQIKKPQAVPDPPPDPFPDPEPITVYPPDPQRELGETEIPCIAVTYLGFRIATELVRTDEVFTPSAEQSSITIPERVGALFTSSLVSSKQEPYQISEGGAAGIKLRVGTPNAWQPEQVACPLPGTRSAAEVGAALNYWLRGVTAWAADGRVHIETIKAAQDLEIIDYEDSLHDVLGFPLGVRSHLTRTGPVGWTVKPFPVPIRLHYQVDVLTRDPEQASALLPFVVDRLRHRQWIDIDGAKLRFDADGSENLDELDKPTCREMFRWWVGPLWVDSLDSYQVKSILTPTIEWAG